MKILSRVFRGKFLAGLKRLHRRNKLCCNGPAAALADPQQFAKLMRRLHHRVVTNLGTVCHVTTGAWLGSSRTRPPGDGESSLMLRLERGRGE